MWLGSDDGRLAIGVPFDDGGGFAGCFVVAAMFDDVVDALLYGLVYLTIEGGAGFAGDVGGSGDEGFAEAFDEMAAEWIVDEADGDGAIFIYEVGGKADGAFVDDGSGLFYSGEEVEDAEVGLAGSAWRGSQPRS